MKNSESRNADVPFDVNSLPTTGPTTSVPASLERAEVGGLHRGLDLGGRARQLRARFLPGVRHAHHDGLQLVGAVGLDDDILPAAGKFLSSADRT